MVTIGDVLIKYMQDNGLDGLCSDGGECGCDASDLASCEYLNLDCSFGKKIPCPKIADPEGEHHCDCEPDKYPEHAWHISTAKHEPAEPLIKVSSINAILSARDLVCPKNMNPKSSYAEGWNECIKFLKGKIAQEAK